MKRNNKVTMLFSVLLAAILTMFLLNGCGGVGTSKGDTITYEDGLTYKGETKNGEPFGEGVFTWPDGNTFTGTMTGKLTGKGTISYVAEDMLERWEYESLTPVLYEGEVVNGMPNGKGVMTYMDNCKFEGNFSNYQWTGEGVYTWADGMTFTGTMVAIGKGNGHVTYKDGAVHDGEVEGFIPHGYGKSTYADGSWYEGGWDGWFQWVGAGVYRAPSNDLFTGTFTGFAKGDVIVQYINGDVYIGKIENFMPEGQGKCIYPDRGVYKGGWSAGKWSGDGTYTFPTGERFVGVMTDQGSGDGVYFDRNNNSYAAKLVNWTAVKK